MDEILHSNYDILQRNSTFSFVPFYNYLQARYSKISALHQVATNYVLEILERKGIHKGSDINAVDLCTYASIFELLHATVTNLTFNTSKELWGVTSPFKLNFVYGTEPLYQFMVDRATGVINNSHELDITIRTTVLKNTYSLILHQLYNITDVFWEDVEYQWFDEESQIDKCHKIITDYRFVDVQFHGELPKLDISVINPYGNGNAYLEYFLKVLPLEQFSFKGLVIVQFEDITMARAIKNIRNVFNYRYIADSMEEKSKWSMEMSNAMRSLLGTSKINIGIFPLLRLHNELVFEVGEGILASKHKELGEINEFVKEYVNNPQPIYYPDTSLEKNIPIGIKQVLEEKDVAYFVVFPVFQNAQLLGLLELYSSTPNVISNEMLLRVENVLKEFALLLQYAHDVFSNKIRSVISDKFTVIQPAVEWKFEEAAWSYIKEKYTNQKPPEIEKIEFKNVFPFYGAIDIRNSSLVRNNAVRADWQLQTELLKTLNEFLLFVPEAQALTKIIVKFIQFLETNNKDIAISGDILVKANNLNEVLRNSVSQYIHSLPQISNELSRYLEDIDEETGICNQNKRLQDKSMKEVIGTIDLLVEEMKQEMQQVLPLYFSKFRTDGVEFDLYMGQSISPNIPLKSEHLFAVHKIQLEYMTKIARSNHVLNSLLDVKLLSTQLIFINPGTIDIVFRADEKRFDVEGSYNIRYQMLKKRIDKICLKGTTERLTQPGKIAIVYLNEEDVQDCLVHIYDAIEKEVLYNLEYGIILENMQGVSGLKAIRVSVSL